MREQHCSHMLLSLHQDSLARGNCSFKSDRRTFIEVDPFFRCAWGDLCRLRERNREGGSGAALVQVHEVEWAHDQVGRKSSFRCNARNIQNRMQKLRVTQRERVATSSPLGPSAPSRCTAPTRLATTLPSICAPSGSALYVIIKKGSV